MTVYRAYAQGFVKRVYEINSLTDLEVLLGLMAALGIVAGRA